MSNINDNFFDGYYKDIWKATIPGILTERELKFILSYFNLQPGQRVLDLMCGYGRHSLGLAAEGMEVYAVDNLQDYITEIDAKAKEQGLTIHTSCASAINFPVPAPCDLAICMGNSLNFFNKADTTTILRNIAAQLKPGGQLLINSWSIAEIAFTKPFTNSWSQYGDKTFLSKGQLLFHPTRIEMETIMIDPQGNREVKPGVDYIFSLNEMEAMLADAGLKLTEVYSIPGRKKFTLGEPRAYLVAQKA